MRVLLLIIVSAVLIGCTSSSRSGDDFVIRHFMREIHLTRQEPTDKELGIMLLRVEPDGAAVISVKETKEVLRAMPGAPFLGRYEKVHGSSVRTFGESGLVLLSSDVAAQSALLERRWAE